MLYSLKRRYGKPATVVWRASDSKNLDTGERTIIRGSQHVKRAVILPKKIERLFSTQVRDEKFSYGGFFDVRNRVILIDRRDLPSDFEIKNGYYIVFRTERFEVQDNTIFENCYIITAEQVTNATAYNVVKKSYYEHLNLTQTVTAVVE